ncbi:hypothetical protein M2157_001610 [Streptomyces sp. SAI-127]|nr:hypothetical protein [Streptomyces sp. SAI-127]
MNSYRILGAGVLHHVEAQRLELGQELGVVGVHAVEPRQEFLRLPLLGQPLVRHLRAVRHGGAGEGTDHLLLRRLVHGEKPHQVPERRPALVPGRALHLVEEVADVTVLTHQHDHDIGVARRDPGHVSSSPGRRRSTGSTSSSREYPCVCRVTEV